MNHLKSLSIACILLSFIVSGCTFTTSRVNREDDKSDAEKVTNRFYTLLKSKNYNAIDNLFSSKFLEVTSMKKVHEIFNTTQNQLGDLVDIKLGDWQTKVVSGTESYSDYQLVYNNHHQKFDSKETFHLMKDDDGKIRIVGFNISSPGFK